MGEKQVSVSIDPTVHGLVQFAAKDRKLQRKWPWKQKEIVAIAVGQWIRKHAGAGVDVERLEEAEPDPPKKAERGGEPLPFERDLFEEGSGTLSFKTRKYVEAAFERVCLYTSTKKGKAVEKALRAWLRQNGYGETLAALEAEEV